MLPDPADIGPISEVLRSRREELGLSQADLAMAVCLVDRPTVSGNNIARWERGKRIPRGNARRALEQALALPIHYLDVAAALERQQRSSEVSKFRPIVALTNLDDPIKKVRAALLDGHRAKQVNDVTKSTGGQPVEEQLNKVMGHYQGSRFGHMILALPDLLGDAHQLTNRATNRNRCRAHRVLALSHQAAAMVLTKAGEHELAWIASQQGLAAAELSEQPAVIGSLKRSFVHSLQSNGRLDASYRMTEETAEDLRTEISPGDDEAASIYGTLLLAGSIVAARAGDRSGSRALLDEADHYATALTEPTDHLWTSFGTANVAVHRVATAVSRDDISGAEVAAVSVDQSVLPPERQARFLFDMAMVAVRRDEPDEAISIMMEAEQAAPQQVYHHVMAQQIVGHLRTTKAGRQTPTLPRSTAGPERARPRRRDRDRRRAQASR